MPEVLEPVRCPACNQTKLSRMENQPQANNATNVAIQIAHVKASFLTLPI